MFFIKNKLSENIYNNIVAMSSSHNEKIIYKLS